MNFCEALKAMQMGNKVSREAWRGQISWWYIPEGKEQIMEGFPDGHEQPRNGIATTNIFADDWWVVT